MYQIKQHARLPPGYFLLSTLFKMCFRWKKWFYSKIAAFSEMKVFQKTLIFLSEKALFGNTTLLYAFYNKFITFTRIEFFPINLGFLKGFKEILLFETYSRTHCFNLVLKNFQSRKSCNLPVSCNWQVYLNRNARSDRKIFFPYYKHGRRIIMAL